MRNEDLLREENSNDLLQEEDEDVQSIIDLHETSLDSESDVDMDDIELDEVNVHDDDNHLQAVITFEDEPDEEDDFHDALDEGDLTNDINDDTEGDIDADIYPDIDAPIDDDTDADIDAPAMLLENEEGSDNEDFDFETVMITLLFF